MMMFGAKILVYPAANKGFRPREANLFPRPLAKASL
jgi:hypothetical protein